LTAFSDSLLNQFPKKRLTKTKPFCLLNDEDVFNKDDSVFNQEQDVFSDGVFQFRVQPISRKAFNQDQVVLFLEGRSRVQPRQFRVQPTKMIPCSK